MQKRLQHSVGTPQDVPINDKQNTNLDIMGKIILKLSLILIFYLLITPISFLLRLAGKDLLNERVDLSSKTYWEKRENEIKSDRYDKQY